MGRLWQSLILGKLHPLFEHLPIENMVYANQQAYYDAIAASTKAGNSGSFIDFMLREILETLRTHQGEEKIPNKVPNKIPNKLKMEFPYIAAAAWQVYSYVKNHSDVTAVDMANALGISDRMVRKHIAALRNAGIIEREGSNKTGRWIVKK